MFNIKNKVVSEIVEWVFCFLIAFVIYLVINYFFGTVTGVKQVSMMPTTVEGDKLLLKRPTVFKQDLKYGDIVSIEAPVDSYNDFVIQPNLVLQGNDALAKFNEYNGLNSFLHNFVGIGKISYVKRIIGLPGDHIFVSDDGYVFRNDIKLEEPYLKDGTTNRNGQFINVIVPENAIFVMGDNRLQSKDSRYFGCVPISKVDGYIITRVWPLNKLGKI